MPIVSQKAQRKGKMERRREKFSEVLIYYTEVEKKNVDCYLWHCFKQEGRDVVGSLTMDLPEMVDATYGYNLKDGEFLKVQKFLQGEELPILDEFRQWMEVPKLSKDFTVWCRMGRLFLAYNRDGNNAELLETSVRTTFVSRADFWTVFDS